MCLTFPKAVCLPISDAFFSINYDIVIENSYEHTLAQETERPKKFVFQFEKKSLTTYRFERYFMSIVTQSCFCYFFLSNYTDTLNIFSSSENVL